MRQSRTTCVRRMSHSEVDDRKNWLASQLGKPVSVANVTGTTVKSATNSQGVELGTFLGPEHLVRIERVTEVSPQLVFVYSSVQLRKDPADDLCAAASRSYSRAREALARRRWTSAT